MPSKKDLKSKNLNLEKEISPNQETSDSVFKNILILVLNMIPTLVFSVWISMSFLRKQEKEYLKEKDANQE